MIKHYICPHCMASLVDIDQTTPLCPYCDSKIEIQSKYGPELTEVEPILLFAKYKRGYFYLATVVQVTEDY